MFVYSVISISTNLNVDTFSSYTTCGAWHSIFISKIRFNEKNSPEHPGFTANKPHLRDAEFNKQDCAWKLKGPQLKTQLMMFGEIYPRQKYPKQGTS